MANWTNEDHPYDFSFWLLGVLIAIGLGLAAWRTWKEWGAGEEQIDPGVPANQTTLYHEGHIIPAYKPE